MPPTQVQGPDGQRYEFPEGTPQQTITQVMQSRYGAPTAGLAQTGTQAGAMRPQQPQSRNAGRTSAFFADSTAAMALAPVPFLNVVPALRLASYNPQTRTGAAAGGFLNASSLDWNDEASGYVAAVGDRLLGRTPNAQTMRQAVEASRDDFRDAQANHPISTLGGQLAGYIAPGGFIGAPAAGVGMTGRIGAAAGVGGTIGAASGAGAAETDDQRLRGAAMGGAMGAAFGGGLQATLGEAAPALWRAGRRALGLPATSSRRMGAAEVALEDVREVTRFNPNLDRAWRQAIAAAPDAAARSNIERMGPLGYAVSQAAETNPNATIAEVLGQGAQNRLAYLGRQGGETGQRIEDFMQARNRNQVPELENAFLGRAPATADTLQESVAQAWRTRGNELYEPLMGNVSPAGQAAFNSRILPRITQGNERYSPVIAEAWDRAGRMIQEEVSLGALPANAAQNLARRLHFTKMALDNMVSDPTTVPRGLQAVDNARLGRIASDFADTLDNGTASAIIPGYRAARAELADYATAERAIDAGRAAFNRTRFRSPEALARHVQNLSPGERPYFLAGVEEELANIIAQAGRDGQRNAASALLADRTQARLRAVFGREADVMIERARVLSQQFEFGQRVRPSRGSITSNVMLQQTGIGAAGGAVLNQEDPLAGLVQGAAVGAITGRIGPALYNRFLGPKTEQARNMLGRFYLTPVGQYQGASGGLLARARQEGALRAQRQAVERTRNAYLTGLAGMGVYQPAQE